MSVERKGRTLLIYPRELQVLLRLLQRATREGTLTKDELAALSNDPFDLVIDLLDKVTGPAAVVVMEEE